ncbi:4Fe-4S binding protein [bacterium]|nr:4Fe-4S binding protein [bacterium]
MKKVTSLSGSKPKWAVLLTAVVMIFMAAQWAAAENRFPKPEFESAYQQPRTTTPDGRGHVFEILDMAVLVLMLILATVFAHRRRSRKALFVLTIVSLLYFGFWRRGCVCPVGSIQNMTLAVFNQSYAVPLTVIVFFSIPILFTLFFGRTFCASVCPLGAVQEFVLLRPATVPFRLSRILGILPVLYLGMAVLAAATGATFLICRFDPFVALFRRSGSFDILLLGLFFIILSTVIGRPYCRFLCPYGVILGWMSKLSRFRVSISPDICVQCRLCENACPYGAISKPVPDDPPESRRTGVRRLRALLIAAPLVIMLMGWSVSLMHPLISRMHYTVRLAEQIVKEETGSTDQTTLESRGFRASGNDPGILIKEAVQIRNRFRTGSWIAGIFFGIVIMGQVLGLSMVRHRNDYEADPQSCFGCGRCFESCPRQHMRKAEK